MTATKRLVPVVLAALLVAAGLFGAWSAWQLHHGDAAANAAVVDAKATAQVQAEVSQALTRVLTYDYRDPATTQAAADKDLTGDARTEYDTLFAALQEKAPDQKLSLAAQVQAVGVRELTDDRATLLVFLDQTSTRAGDDESTVAAAQLTVTARRHAGAWQITSLKPL